LGLVSVSAYLSCGSAREKPNDAAQHGLDVWLCHERPHEPIELLHRPERIQAYTIWSYGSFSVCTWNQLKVKAPVILVGLGIAVFLTKPLNACFWVKIMPATWD
jgi:hypothetical protein